MHIFFVYSIFRHFLLSLFPPVHALFLRILNLPTFFVEFISTGACTFSSYTQSSDIFCWVYFHRCMHFFFVYSFLLNLFPPVHALLLRILFFLEFISTSACSFSSYTLFFWVYIDQCMLFFFVYSIFRPIFFVELISTGACTFTSYTLFFLSLFPPMHALLLRILFYCWVYFHRCMHFFFVYSIFRHFLLSLFPPMHALLLCILFFCWVYFHRCMHRWK